MKQSAASRVMFFCLVMLVGSLRLSMSLSASKKRILSIPHLMNSWRVFSMSVLS